MHRWHSALAIRSVPVLSLFPSFLLFLCLPYPASGLHIDCGFGGQINAEEWFPVRVAAEPGFERFAVEITDQPQGEAGAGEERVLARVTGRLDPETGRGTASCKLVDFGRYGMYGGSKAMSARGTVIHRDGRMQTAIAPVVPANLKPVLLVTDSPADFSFLPSVKSGQGREAFRPVRVTPADFPEHWVELSSVSFVILDGTRGSSFRESQRRALRDWILLGGTVIVTDRAILAGADQGHWGLAGDFRVGASHSSVLSPELASLAGKYRDYVRGVPALPLRVPGPNRILWCGETTLVAGIDRGLGRVLFLGFDWRNLGMADHVIYEGARNALWREILSFGAPSRASSGSGPGNDLVVPREARARYLLVYVLVFLCLFLLVLSLGNWFVLRRLRRLEFSVLSLPLAAVGFAVAAFAVGYGLRGSRTLIRQADILFAGAAPDAALVGQIGVLSPSRTPFRLISGLPSQVNDLETGGSREFVLRGKGAAPAYGWQDLPELGGIRIQTWSMAFFPTRAVLPAGGGLSATGRFTTNGLAGRIENRLPHPLRNAQVILGWNRAPLGDIASGETRDFFLPMTPPSAKTRAPCPNCGRYHGGLQGPWPETGPSVPPELRMLADAALSRLPHRPVIVALTDATSAVASVDRAAVSPVSFRLCAATVDLLPPDGDSLAYPPGAMRAQGLLPPPALAAVADSRRQYAHLLEGIVKREMEERRAKSDAESPMLRDQVDVDMSDEDQLEKYGHHALSGLSAFYLPTVTESARTQCIELRWMVSGGEEEESPFAAGRRPRSSPATLSAYDWETKEWAEVATATAGEHCVRLERPGRFVAFPPGLILLKTGGGTPDAPPAGTVYLAVSYEGRTEASGGPTP